MNKLVHEQRGKDMKPIESELQERLSKLRLDWKLALKKFKATEETLLQMIIEEEQFYPKKGKLSSNGISPLMEGLLQRLNVCEEEELSNLVIYVRDRDLLPPKKSPGRVVHGALLYLNKLGKVERVRSRVWKIRENERAAPNLESK